MGEQSMDIFRSFTFTYDDDKNKWKPVVNKLQNYLTPKTNVVLERFNFNKTVRDEGELFD